MKISLCDIRYLNVTSNCPTCGRESGTDKGKCTVANLKPQVGFWCEEHGEWFEDVNWGDELNKLIAAHRAEEQDKYDGKK